MEKGWKPNASRPMLTMLVGDTLDLTCRCGEHQRIRMEEIHKGSGPLNPSADMTLWEQDRMEPSDGE